MHTVSIISYADCVVQVSEQSVILSLFGTRVMAVVVHRSRLRLPT